MHRHRLMFVEKVQLQMKNSKIYNSKEGAATRTHARTHARTRTHSKISHKKSAATRTHAHARTAKYLTHKKMPQRARTRARMHALSCRSMKNSKISKVKEILYPQFTHMIFIIYTHVIKRCRNVYTRARTHATKSVTSDAKEIGTDTCMTAGHSNSEQTKWRH